MLYFSRLKVLSIISIIVIGIYFFLPNILFLGNNKFFSEKKINLGLDLQGGSYLLLEIDSEPLIMQRLQAKSLEIRRALREKNIQYKDFNFTGKSLFFNYEIDYFNQSINIFFTFALYLIFTYLFKVADGIISGRYQ